MTDDELKDKIRDRLKFVEYTDLIATMGVEVVADEDCGDYSGDWVYLVKRDGVFGVLIVGYGSCSYCDPLQAVDDSVGDTIALRDQLKAEILWPVDGGTLRERVEEKEGASPFWLYDDLTKAAVWRFVEMAEA